MKSIPILVALSLLAGCRTAGPDAAADLKSSPRGSNPFDAQLGSGRNKVFQFADGSGSYLIRYTRWMPAAAKDQRKVIIYNHGLQSHRRWFNSSANALAQSGYGVYAFDRIGSGDSDVVIESRKWDSANLAAQGIQRPGRGHIGHWTQFTKTLEQMVSIARRENPGSKIILWGNSYGAKVVSAYLLDKSHASGVEKAIFTTPGLFSNRRSFPLPFRVSQLLTSRATKYLPTPITEKNGDNGAAWFVRPGPWFEKIKRDTLSLRSVTAGFYKQTGAMDRFISDRKAFIERQPLTIKVPAFYLMVRGDKMMDNRKMERWIKSYQGARHEEKYYRGGPMNKHLLFFSEDADQAMRDIKRFLED